MKSFSLLLAVASVAVSLPLVLGENVQAHFDVDNLDNHPQSYPGFHLDLNALRWVELEGQEPVLMTELEKVIPFLLGSDIEDLC